MVHLHLTPEALVKTRFTYSPLIETAMSYRLLRGVERSTGNHRRWIEQTERALSDVDLPLMNALMLTKSYVPDFLTPTPGQMQTVLEPDLRRLAATPRERIEHDLTWLTEDSADLELRDPLVEAFRARPDEHMPALIDELHTYWDRALAPHWQNLMSVVEGDILFRARQMALDGNDRVLNDLNPIATFDGKALRLNKHHYSRRHREDEYHIIDSEGLHLVPSAFTDNHVMWQVAPAYAPMVIYGARGVGTWQIAQPELDESLELLLGSGRASVLQKLEDTPATTTELAHNLHFTAGAISQHLAILNRAGLVHPQRSGRRVYYALSNKGEELLRLFR